MVNKSLFLIFLLLSTSSCNSFLHYSGLKNPHFDNSKNRETEVQFQNLIGVFSTDTARGHYSVLNIQNSNEINLINHNSFGTTESFGRGKISENLLIIEFDSSHFHDPLELNPPYKQYDKFGKVFYVDEGELYEQKENGRFSLNESLKKR